MGTWIIGGIVAIIVAVVAYRQFFKKASGCHDCHDVGCPLFDQAQRLQENNKKRAV